MCAAYGVSFSVDTLFECQFTSGDMRKHSRLLSQQQLQQILTGCCCTPADILVGMSDGKHVKVEKAVVVESVALMSTVMAEN